MAERNTFPVPRGLLERCRRVYGWNNQYASNALKAYRQLMELKVQHEDWDATILSPSFVVDRIWHQHILDVKHYVEACESYCEHIVGHDPDGGLDEAARDERIKTTKISLKARFGRDYDSDIWSFGEEDRKRGRVSPDEVEVLRKSQAMFHEKKQKIASDIRQITLRVRDQTGEETFFLMRPTTKFQKVFAIYAARKGIDDVTHFRFLCDGEKVEPHQTPEMWEMEDNDQIDAILHEAGC